MCFGMDALMLMNIGMLFQLMGLINQHAQGIGKDFHNGSKIVDMNQLELFE